MTENFPILVKEIDIQVQEIQKIPKKMNQKRPTPRHIIKMQKAKDKKNHLKVARKKRLFTYKTAPIRLSADFSKKLCRPEGTGQKYSK